MASTQQKWTMDRLINPLTRKISLTSLKAGYTDTQQISSPRKPMKADHSLSTNTYNNSGIRNSGYNKNSALNLPSRPLCRDKTNFSSGGNSQFSKRTNEPKRTDKYTIERPLSPRSQSDALLKKSKMRLMKMNEDRKTSTNRFTQSSLRQQPSSIRRADSNPVITSSQPTRSTSFNSGNLLRSRTRSSSISQVDANVPLPGITRTRRNSFDSSSLVGSRPASRNSPSTSPNIEQQNSFMSGKSTLDIRIKSGTSKSHSIYSNQGTCGLINLGNTCFMNSILQCLAKEKTLRKYFCSKSHTKSPMRSIKLANAFGRLMDEMWSNDNVGEAINPNYVKHEVQRLCQRFMGTRQHDSQEFLRTLIEGLHDELNRIKTKPTYTYDDLDDMRDNEKGGVVWKRYISREQSVIQDLFVGQLRSTLTCSTCNHASVTFDPFWDLSLPIPSKLLDSVNINQCFQAFTQEEVLDGSEKPTCEKCKKLRRCTKRFLIEKCPKVLVIHLKRFSGQRYRTKLTAKVNFPHELDIGQFTVSRERRMFRLFGVSNHIGGTGGGHYTAFAKHPDTSQWNLYNDARVSTANARDVVTSGAYVLFYELVED